MNKRFISGLAALAVVFAGAGALPAGTFEGFSLTASAAETYGNFKYTILDNGTIEIFNYKGTDENVIIPSEIDGKSVTSIRRYTFEYFTSLESISIPNSVTSIKENTFWGCSKLTNITIPDSVTSIGEGAFGECTSLESVTLPDSITNIGSNAFCRCQKLTNINIPKSVLNIGIYAFYDCTSLTNVTISSSVTKIDQFAFGYYATIDNWLKKLDGFTINGYKDTAAETYANDNDFKFNAIDNYPVVKYKVQGNQFSLKWTAVQGAEKYGLAVYQSGKWRLKAHFADDITSCTSPKMNKGTYKMVVCAKLNGKWDKSNYSRRAFTVTIE